MPGWATELKSETLAAFDRYVKISEAQMNEEPRDQKFLIVDRLPESQRQTVYEQLQHGQTFIQELHTLEGHQAIRIPSGMVHHWAGVIFIPKAKLSEVNAVLQDYQNEASIYKPEIRKAKLIEQHGNESKIFLQMYTKSIITVVLNGYFDVIETPIGNTRFESASHSTRIAEVANPGGPDEREIPEAQSYGYMWRLSSYWRIEEKDGGVYVQNESITLTRTVPVLLAWLINPLTKSIPRDVIVHMLTDTQAAVSRAGKDPK
ncbi:MAG TPA: hypothetical protein VGI34_08990 [Candidatus Acidoferrales bacterium]|jgi:hypothetical protein